MKTLGLVLLALLSGCAFFGNITQAGATVLGGAAGAALGGPAGAAIGAGAGFYAGDMAAEELTGTRSTRVSTEAGGSGQSLGDSLGDAALGAAGIPNTSTMLWIVIAVIAFFSLGGPAWVARQAAKRKQEDDAWARGLETERMNHQSRTAALESQVKQLRADMDKIIGRKPRGR